KRLCSIYKSPRRNEMYLYVERSEALTRVPEALLAAFGPPQHAFDLVLTPERKLAREDIATVLANLEKQGYHLQMPPAEDEYIEHNPEELLRRNNPLCPKRDSPDVGSRAVATGHAWPLPAQWLDSRLSIRDDGPRAANVEPFWRRKPLAELDASEWE